MGGLVRTHLAIDRRWSGEVTAVGAGTARVRLATLPEMVADADCLVHGGFVFSLADYCAMLTVNEPNVVLASAEMEFVAPVAVGDVIEATGALLGSEGRRHEVEVVVERLASEEGGEEGPVVARGRFRCVVTKRHVLRPKESDRGGEGEP